MRSLLITTVLAGAAGWPEKTIASRSFRQDAIKIGRLPTSTLVLDDPDVARMHAVIEADGMRVIDLGSETGTLVNNTRVNGSASLDDGAELTIGPFILKVKVEMEAERLAAEAAPTVLDILTTAEQRQAVKDRLAALEATARDAMHRHRQADDDFHRAMLELTHEAAVARRYGLPSTIDPYLALDAPRRAPGGATDA